MHHPFLREPLAKFVAFPVNFYAKLNPFVEQAATPGTKFKLCKGNYLRYDEKVNVFGLGSKLYRFNSYCFYCFFKRVKFF